MGRLKGCRTEFLGWDRPLLHSAVDYLWNLRQPGQAKTWKLDDFLAVLPTRRGTRRFRTLLLDAARDRGVEVTLPQIITVGELPEQLYSHGGEPQGADPAQPRRIADELERTLAWAETLRSTQTDVLKPLFASLPPADSLGPWMELAGTLRHLHEELAAAELTFADVAAELGDATPTERARWEQMQRLGRRYLATLADAGLDDLSAARRQAVTSGRCRCDRHVLLIGTSDLSSAVTSMLRTAASDESGDVTQVTALVAADQKIRDHFDPFGSIIAAAWARRHLPIKDSQLVSATDVNDQASAAVDWIFGFVPETPPGRITVGVTDESLVPAIEFELRQSGLAAYRELGWSYAQTPVGRLMELLSEHLSRRTWQSLAALVRHADVYALIDRQLSERTGGEAENSNSGRWLTALDELAAEHYPTRLDVPPAEPWPAKYPAAFAVSELVEGWLAGLNDIDEQPLSRWAAAVEQFLERIWPQAAEPASEAEDASATARRQADALQATRRVLRSFTCLRGTFDVVTRVGWAMELVTSSLVARRIADVMRPDAVTIAGWLDLALEDAPVMAIVGLNHPYVPEAVTADPFLPGSLRTRLRMSDNERRLGRDIYALQLILAARPDVRLIVGRTGIDGSPTPPSRLLAAGSPEDTARRLVRLLDDSKPAGDAESPRPRRWVAAAEATRLAIPPADANVRIDALSVTSFSIYLQCPYRFYLRHVLKLRPLDDASRELAANQFGDLVHNSLELFGNSPDKDSADESVVEAAMTAALDEIALKYYGTEAAPAVRLQIEQARRRLRNVARVQARRRAEGWRIVEVEASVGEHNGAGIDVDGKRTIIRGRFDRIDRHEDGRWAILDYKTHGELPRKKHLQKDGDSVRWVDLQLPIYRLMIPYLVGDDVDPETVSLGYFNVSDKEQQTCINEADFTPEEFAEAEQLIAEIIRSIRAGRFTPADDPPMFDDYGMILQTGSAQNLIDALDDEAMWEAEELTTG